MKHRIGGDDMKNFFLICQMLCFLVCAAPAPSSALFLPGPSLNQHEEGWDLFGLLVRAEQDVVLVSVHYPNQGFADLIETRLHADGSTICASPVSAGNYDATVVLNCPLAAGEEYEIVSTTRNNSYWTDFSQWPLGNEEITVLSSYGNHVRFPYSYYWFAFDGITTQIDAHIIVPVDIKPGSSRNTINLKAKGVVPVALFSSETFDASAVDIMTVQFGPEHAAETHGSAHLEDINDDSLPDMVFHFRIQETGIRCGDTEATLTGETYYGEVFEGTDLIRTVKCK